MRKRVVAWWPAVKILKIAALVLGAICVKRFVEIGNKDRVPKEGPLLISINHLTTAEEVGTLLVLLPQHFHFIYKVDLEGGRFGDVFSKSLFTEHPKGIRGRLLSFVSRLVNFVLGFFIVKPVLRLAGHIPTRREIKETTAVEMADSVIDQKGLLLATPERTSRHEGLIYARGRGTARLAMKKDCPVITIGISGAPGTIVQGFLSYIGLGEKQTLTAAYGIPFRLSELGLNLINDPEGEEATHQIMVRIAASLPTNMRGYYRQAAEEFLQSDAFDAKHYRELQPMLN